MKTVSVVLKAHVVSDHPGARTLRLITGYGEPVVFVDKRRAPIVESLKRGTTYTKMYGRRSK